MKVVKIITKLIIAIFLIPLFYILISLFLTIIPINGDTGDTEKDMSIYLNSNGVHLNIIIPKNNVAINLIDGLNYNNEDQYFSFGWGDRNFYLETPTWNDLTFKNTFVALFLKSSTLVHFTRYTSTRGDWMEIKVNQYQLEKINQYIYESFYSDPQNKKVLLYNSGYSNNDDFYEAVGSYSFYKTCNSWVNTGLKEGNVKACLWTPFEFGLLFIHEN